MGLFGRRPRALVGNPNEGGRGLDSLTAAGQRIGRREGDNVRRLIQPWQSRAFSYYDQLGEVWYASQFYARMMSPLRLYAAEKDDDGDWIETDQPDAVAALDRIQDPGGGREGLQSSYGRLLFVAGESYLLCSVDPDTGLEQWEMLSTDELRVQGGTYVRYKAPSMVAEQLYEADDDDFAPLDPDRAVVYRLWRRHPRYSALADGPMKGVLDICEELLLLTRGVRARARSRLAGAGILAISEDFSHAPLEPTPDEDPNLDPLLRDLIDAMMAPLANEGAASAVVPLILRAPTDVIEKGIRHIQIVDPTQLYPETGLRYECIKRLALGLDLPPEVLLGMTDANHWCVDEKTEILTADGWRRHDEISVGDEVLTLNHESGASEWQPTQDVYRADVRREPMRELSSRTHSSLTTAQHRWPVIRPRWAHDRVAAAVVGRDLVTARVLANRTWAPSREWTTSSELSANDSIVTAAPHDGPSVRTYSDDLVELVAWFWTEGSVGGNVTIAQSHTRNPDRVDRIRRLLGRLYGPASETLRGSTSPAWREVLQENRSSFGGPITVFRLNKHAAAALLEAAPAKRVLLSFVRALTRAQLELFIDVSCQADGHHYSQGTLDIWQRDSRSLDGFELAAILAGYAVSRLTRDGGDVVRILKADSVRPIKAAQQAARTEIEGASDRVVLYDGVVWCPVTPNHTWLARRDGRVFFTGNSAWMVDEQTWKAHGKPASDQLVGDLTAAYFLPELRAAGVSDWARYSIRYDASAVVNHPDRSTDAQKLYDRRAIGKRALRDAGGFGEDDAPEPDELNEMIGVAVRDGSLAVYGIPSLKAGGIETEPGEVVTGDSESGTPEAATTGADVEAAPPAEQPTPEAVVGSSALDAARVLGAADIALLRARELAGNRILSRAKRNGGELLREIEEAGVRARDVTAFLGPDRVRGLVSEQELLAGVRDVLEEALAMWGLAEGTRELLVAQIERHAARTIYDARPTPLPPRFHAYAVGVLAKER